MNPATDDIQINLDVIDMAALGAVVFVAVLAALLIAKHL